MSSPLPIQTAWLGMRQDQPRDQLGNAVWNMRDFIPEKLSAPLQKRGGWTWASPAISGANYIQAMVRTPEYGAGAYNLLIDDQNEAWRFTDNASTDEGSTVSVAQNPVVHRSGADWVVVIPADDGTTAPQSWTGPGSIGVLSATAPAAIYAAVWEDRTLLANGTSDAVRYVSRLWFGPVGDAAGVWDVESAWVDFNLPIVGLAVLRNAILVFHSRSADRIRGTSPPFTPDIAATPDEVIVAEGDLTVDRPFDVGCIDARSIVEYQDTVIWADFTGVYQSDGVAIKNLTEEGGIQAYWHGNLINYDGYHVTAGLFKDTYIVTVLDGDRAEIDCLAYDLTRGHWYRFTNFPSLTFMRVPGASAEKTYMGLATQARVANLEGVFHDQIPADADGTGIEPMLETGVYRGFSRLHRRWIPSQAIQHWRRLYLNYELADSGFAPVLTVSYSLNALDPELTTYTALTPDIAASTRIDNRIRRNLFFQSRGVAFKIQQTGQSNDTTIRNLEAEYEPLEAGRLVQV